MSSSVALPGKPDPVLPPPVLTEVSDGVFAYVQPDGTWWVNNTGLVVGERGAVGIDSCATERRTRAWVDTIARTTDAPVRTLVNTHHHGDHTHGNWLFPGATIVGHEGTRAGVLAAGVMPTQDFWTPFDLGEVQVAPPFLTYTEGVTLWVDDLRCEVRHVGTPAHTTNDSIVWLPERRTLFAGDLLFAGGTPFLVMGSLTGAIEVLTDVLAPLGAETIVAGHGPVADGSLVDDVLGYLRWLDGVARDSFDAGVAPLEAARQVDLGPYAEWADPERIVGNLHRAHAELSGVERGGRIDVGAALTDMVAFNGGHKLTCIA